VSPVPAIGGRDRAMSAPDVELAECMATLDRFMAALNANDAAAIPWTFFRTDGSAIGIYESLYLLTLKDRRRGIQARSSFGP